MRSLLLLGGVLAMMAAGGAEAQASCEEGTVAVTGAVYQVCVLYAGDAQDGWVTTHTNTPASVSVAQPLSYPYVVSAGAGVAQVNYSAVSPYGSSYTARWTKAEVATFAPYVGYSGADVWQYQWESSFPGYYHYTGRFTRAHVQLGPAGVNAAEYAYGDGAPCMTDVRVEFSAYGVAAPGLACPVEAPVVPDFPAPPL